MLYNGATQRWIQTVTVRNNGGTSATNVALVLDSLSSNATLANATGSTTCTPANSPYLGLGTINPAQTATATLQFVNPSNAAINYNTRVLAGSGIQ